MENIVKTHEIEYNYWAFIYKNPIKFNKKEGDKVLC